MEKKWDDIVASAAVKSGWLRQYLAALLLAIVAGFLLIVLTQGLHSAFDAISYALKNVWIIPAIAAFGRYLVLPGLANILKADVAHQYLNLLINPILVFLQFQEIFASRIPEVLLSPPRRAVLA